MQDMDGQTVGQVSRDLGVTVRTLHHYDGIGLVIPSGRTAAGYRVYETQDLERLQAVVVYRRLGFSLSEISQILQAPVSVGEHLRRQRAVVLERLNEMQDLVTAIDNALEAEMTNRPATAAQLKQLHGNQFDDVYAREAENRWGDRAEWNQAALRTEKYDESDWAEIKAEEAAINNAFIVAKRAGKTPDSLPAMDAAEAHREHIHRRFHDLDHASHKDLAELYVSDQRFTAKYDALEPGLAQYIRDAIMANAGRMADLKE